MENKEDTPLDQPQVDGGGWQPIARFRERIEALPRHSVKCSVPDHEHGYRVEVRDFVELDRVLALLPKEPLPDPPRSDGEA